MASRLFCPCMQPHGRIYMDITYIPLDQGQTHMHPADTATMTPTVTPDLNTPPTAQTHGSPPSAVQTQGSPAAQTQGSPLVSGTLAVSLPSLGELLAQCAVQGATGEMGARVVQVRGRGVNVVCGCMCVSMSVRQGKGAGGIRASAERSVGWVHAPVCAERIL